MSKEISKLIYDSQISEISEINDDYKDILHMNLLLSKEIDETRNNLKKKEFELNTVIQTFTLENETLKKSIKSYSELVDYYKNIDNKVTDAIKNELQSKNFEAFSKIRELETNILLIEQREYNLKREIISLNSIINDLKLELEINNRNSNKNKLIEFNENEVKELINEIDELKKENELISERALNMLTEKEVQIMQLKEEIKESKNVSYDDVSLLKNNLGFVEFSKEQEAKWNNEKDQLIGIIEDLENKVITIQNEYKLELSKYEIKENTIDENNYLNMEKKLEENENYYKNQLSFLKKELDELDIENNSNLKKIEKLNSELNSLMTSNADKIKKIQEKFAYEMQIKLKEAEDKNMNISKLENELIETKKKLEISHKDYIESKNQLDLINEEYNDMRRRTEERLSSEIFLTFEDNIYDRNETYPDDLFNDDLDNHLTHLRKKIHTLEDDKKKLKNRLKLLEAKLNSKLFGPNDLIKFEKMKIKNEMNEMKKTYESQINDLVHKIQGINENDKPSKKPDNLEIAELKEKINNYNAEIKFLNEKIEIMNNDIENTKSIKDSIIKNLKEEINELKDVVTDAKIKLAQIVYEKDMEIMKYKIANKNMKSKIEKFVNKSTRDSINLSGISKQSL